MTLSKPNESSLRDVIRPGESRGLDFVKLSELNRRTSIDHDILLFGIRELLTNGLDKDATHIIQKIERDTQLDWLITKDNGSKKLTRAELDLILDFDHPASSKRGLHQIQRGSLGNALKCIFGYTYALSEAKGIEPPLIFVASGEFEWKIWLKPDKILQKIDHQIEETKRNDDGYTSLKVAFPIEHTVEESKAMLRQILEGTGMVNPTRKIGYDLYGDIGTVGTGETGSELRKPEISALWYNLSQFTELFHDYQRARPNEPAQNFVKIFRGFSGYHAQRELFEAASVIQQEEKADPSKNCTQNVDFKNGKMQFLATTPLRDFTDQAIAQLFAILKVESKPIAKKSIPYVLGCVGEAAFCRLKEQNGWLLRKRGNYIMLKETRRICPTWRHDKGKRCEDINHVEFPYLVELAVFDRPDDGKGLQVFQCVNFMATIDAVLSQMFNVSNRLGAAHINETTPITIIIHLVSPVLGWLNYGKTDLSNVDTFGLIQKCFDKLLPIEKEYRYRPPPSQPYSSWVPKGNFYNESYRQQLRIFAQEILAIDRLSSFHIRPRMRGWGYRCEQLGKIDKGEFNALAHAINDCRKLKYLSMDIISPDPDGSRRFQGIHRVTGIKAVLGQLRNHITETLGSLPSIVTDFYKGEKYYLMMIVEKGEILQLFGPICEQYGFIPYVSSKGWSNLEIRANIAEQCKWAAEHGLKPVLLCFYDMDPKGEEIPDRFRRHLKDMEAATGWEPDDMEIVRFGLTEKQIDTFKLSWVHNLKTSGGKEAKRTRSVLAYIDRHGEKKCEMESLYKDDGTTRDAEQICREAIEHYLGKDAVERFRKKIEESREKLEVLYGSPVWKQFDDELQRMVETLPEELKSEPTTTPEAEKEIEVFINDKYYGKCPKCGKSFNDMVVETGKLVRCRKCNSLLRIRRKQEARIGENSPIDEQFAQQILQDLNDKLNEMMKEVPDNEDGSISH